MKNPMKFIYKKKHQKSNLIIGVLWILLGTGAILFNEGDKNWFLGANIGLGIVYLGTYIYNHFTGYISIEDGIIKESGLFGTKLEIAKITFFKKFASDYILTAGDKKLNINTHLIGEK
tara:strand:- start:2731 stop:3084 length:354 start_codon:yes stop_codon:yes gene_type:complete